MDDLDKRAFDTFKYIPGEKEELREIVGLWSGGTFEELTGAQISQEKWDFMDINVMTKGISKLSTMNLNSYYDTLVKVGYRHYIRFCKEKNQK